MVVMRVMLEDQEENQRKEGVVENWKNNSIRQTRWKCWGDGGVGEHDGGGGK